MGHDQSNVVVLLAWAELPELIDDRAHQSFRRKITMSLQRRYQALLAEFLAVWTAAFGDPVSV